MPKDIQKTLVKSTVDFSANMKQLVDQNIQNVHILDNDFYGCLLEAMGIDPVVAYDKLKIDSDGANDKIKSELWKTEL